MSHLTVKVSERGCLLQLSQAGKSKCESKDKQCQKCSGELCNNMGRIDFQCIQCNGSEVSSPIIPIKRDFAISRSILHRTPSATRKETFYNHRSVRRPLQVIPIAM